MVKKHNRRLYAGICLLIAFKSTDVYGGYDKNIKLFSMFNDDLFKFMRYVP
jgi:hypothetical protein